MLNMKRSHLERLMHAAVFAAIGCSLSNKPGDCGRWLAHGMRPSDCNARARIRLSVSLNSTSASRSLRSCGVSMPSVLRFYQFLQPVVGLRGKA